MDTILQVAALDDAVSLIAFSVCAAFVQASSSNGSVTVSQIAFPVLFNLLALALGGLSGVVLSRLIHKRRSKDHSLVLACVTIMGVAGICTSLNVSPLLARMASGTAYINASCNKHLFKQLNQFTPPLLVVFFVLSGMRLSIPSLAAAGVSGIVYFLFRIIHRLCPGRRGYPRFTGNPPLLWPGADSSGRCFHRPGCTGTAYAPRRKRPAAFHHHSVQRAAVADKAAVAGKAAVNRPSATKAEEAEQPTVHKAGATALEEHELKKSQTAVRKRILLYQPGKSLQYI